MNPKELKQNKMFKQEIYKKHVKKEAQFIDNSNSFPHVNREVSFEQYQKSVDEILNDQILKNEKRIRNNNRNKKKDQRSASHPKQFQIDDVILK